MPKPSVVPRRPPALHDSGGKQRSPSHEIVAPKLRRTFSPSEKLRLVKAADAAVASGERGALESLLRREGIYSSHLSAWRKQLTSRGTEGLVDKRPGRKPKLDDQGRQVLVLTKELAVVKRKLLVANAIIDLQKKAHEILGLTLPTFDEAT